jgi:hypothetical protein
MLQSYRTIQIEKLAAILPIPIKYQSRRRQHRDLRLPRKPRRASSVIFKDF